MDSNSFPKRLGNTCIQHASDAWHYQEKAAEDALAEAMRSGKAVLAMFCGGGKTTTSQLIIKKFIKRNGNQSRILVVTENNNALKQQYLVELINAHVPIDFTYGDIDRACPESR